MIAIGSFIQDLETEIYLGPGKLADHFKMVIFTLITPSRIIPISRAAT